MPLVDSELFISLQEDLEYALVAKSRRVVLEGWISGPKIKGKETILH